MKIAQIPMCQVYVAASIRNPDPVRQRLARWRNAGPKTKKTIPKVLGVSSPSGIAVTSSAGSPGQAEGHPSEEQIAHQHPDRRAGNHVLQGEFCRKSKDAR